MSDLLKKIKPFLPKLFQKKVSYDKGGLRPSRDWRNILITTFLTLCILASFSFYFYLQVGAGKFFAVTQEDTQNEVKINRNLLDKVVKDINDRKASLEQIKQNKIVPPDPSL